MDALTGPRPGDGDEDDGGRQQEGGVLLHLGAVVEDHHRLPPLISQLGRGKTWEITTSTLEDTVRFSFDLGQVKQLLLGALHKGRPRVRNYYGILDSPLPTFGY